jgi:hypothetical protein
MVCCRKEGNRLKVFWKKEQVTIFLHMREEGTEDEKVCNELHHNLYSFLNIVSAISR